jgi:hypothetical protein
LVGGSHFGEDEAVRAVAYLAIRNSNRRHVSSTQAIHYKIAYPSRISDLVRLNDFALLFQ